MLFAASQENLWLLPILQQLFPIFHYTIELYCPNYVTKFIETEAQLLDYLVILPLQWRMCLFNNFTSVSHKIIL